MFTAKQIQKASENGPVCFKNEKGDQLEIFYHQRFGNGLFAMMFNGRYRCWKMYQSMKAEADRMIKKYGLLLEPNVNFYD